MSNIIPLPDYFNRRTRVLDNYNEASIDALSEEEFERVLSLIDEEMLERLQERGME